MAWRFCCTLGRLVWGQRTARDTMLLHYRFVKEITMDSYNEMTLHLPACLCWDELGV